jgi:hypothetical protein
MCRDVIQPVSVVAIVPNDPAIAVFAQVFLTVAARRRFLRRLRIARITPKELCRKKHFNRGLPQPMDIEASPQIR